MVHHHISCFPPVLRITVAEALGEGVAGDLELGDLKQILFIYGFLLGDLEQILLKPIIFKIIYIPTYGECKLCQFEAF